VSRVRHGVCTIVDSSYLPQALALSCSLRSTQSDDVAIFVLLLNLENPPNGEISGVTFLTISDLGIPPDELELFRLAYDVVELATAIKPRLLKYILEVDFDVVTYVDPDVLVFHSLSDTSRLTTEYQIVLTPHRITPCDVKNINSQERRFLRYGTFNLGFVSVSKKATEFLSWWSTRTTWFATKATFGDYFTDQKWINLVPSMFEHTVMRHPGYNVAPWNLDERHLTNSDGKWFALGKPLVLFHYSQMSSQIRDGHGDISLLNTSKDYNLNQGDYSTLSIFVREYERELKNISELKDKLIAELVTTPLPAPLPNVLRISLLNQSFQNYLHNGLKNVRNRVWLSKLVVTIHKLVGQKFFRLMTVEKLFVGLMEDWSKLRRKRNPWF
jgi:hypothetical protein